MRLSIAMLILTGWVTHSAAHTPAGFEAFAAGIPSDKLAQIQFDGDISDWAWMPDTFTWTMSSPWPGVVSDGVSSGSTPRDDFDVLFFLAWSPETNMLYHVGRIIDDLQFSRAEDYSVSFAEDNYMWLLDADHSADPDFGQEGNDSRRAQQFGWTPDEKIVVFWQIEGSGVEPGPLKWVTDEPQMFQAGETIDNDWTFEIAQITYDELSFDGPDASAVHTLTAGEVIGLGMTIEDQDTEDPKDEVAWRLGDLATQGENASDVLLVSVADTEAEIPTATEARTWGRIKAAFGSE